MTIVYMSSSMVSAAYADTAFSNEKLVAKGKQLFILCGSCHSNVAVESIKIGPHLAGIFNRKVAAVEGYNYSSALRKTDFSWDEKQLDKWLTNPASMLPGTKMAFPGLGESQRQAIIAYLKTL